MLFRSAQIVWRAADLALTQTHYAAAFTKTLDVYFCATHDSCSHIVAESCRLRGRLSARKCQIEPETQKMGYASRKAFQAWLHLRRPWINDINATVLKVLHVARREACSSRTSHCDNHGIELADWFTCRSSRGGDFRVHVRSLAVET